jgi:hypothetical protein
VATLYDTFKLSYTCKRVDIDTVDAVRSFIDTIEHGCMVVNDHTVWAQCHPFWALNHVSAPELEVTHGCPPEIELSSHFDLWKLQIYKSITSVYVATPTAYASPGNMSAYLPVQF